MCTSENIGGKEVGKEAGSESETHRERGEMERRVEGGREARTRQTKKGVRVQGTC